MNISPINPNTSFCAKLEMSRNYRTRLYSKTDNYCDKEVLYGDINKTIRKIQNSPIEDSYKLENIIDLKRYDLSGGSQHKTITPLNVVYKNGEKLGVYPGREKRFIKKFEKSLDLQTKHPEAFKKIGMDEDSIIRMCNEIPNSSTDEIENALTKIETSDKQKKYTFSSESVDGDIYSRRKNILRNEDGKIVKKKRCPVADFIVKIAKKYF